MKNTWLIWVLIVGVVITALIAFNHKAAKQDISLGELFPDETMMQNVEYEFIQNQQSATIPSSAPGAVKSVPRAASIPSTTPPPVITTQKVVADVPGGDIKKIPFTIQIASFKDKVKAEKIVEDLAKKQFVPYIVSNNLGDKGIWYRVYVGNFDSKAQAEETLAKVKADYKESFIISPKKETK